MTTPGEHFAPLVMDAGKILRPPSDAQVEAQAQTFLDRAKPQRHWVVGFMFDRDTTRVVLIRKNRPEWQAGKLNGVGGKVEMVDRTWPEGEIKEAADLAVLRRAIVREFEEETGVETPFHVWHHFADLTWEQGIVHFLRCFVSPTVLDETRTVTDEAIELHWTHLVGTGPITPNLLWLVPLAAHRHDSYDVIDVVETGTTMRKPGRLDVHPG